MDPAILDYLTLAVGGLSLTTLGFAIAWLRARERAIRAEERAELGRPSTIAEARFDRLDQSMEALAIEMERIAEAERFQSRLMANRVSGSAPPEHPPRAAGIVTPH
jgi:hypothetical protein